MQATGTFAQFQSVVAALAVSTMLYSLSGSDVQSAALVELEFRWGFSSGQFPTEAAFIAAFPSAIKVAGIGA